MAVAAGGAGDSGHETLVSTEEDDSPTPTVERASSEVIYSTIGNRSVETNARTIGGLRMHHATPFNFSSGPTGTSNFARSRLSLAEPPSNTAAATSVGGAGAGNSSVPIYEDIDQYHSQPPMIAPVSGVPNVKVGKIMRSN